MQFSIILAATFIAAVAAQNSPTPNGSCGGANNFECTTASFGGCCSAYGYCGDSASHCGAGCQADLSAPDACTTGVVPSVDGSCGPANDFTCSGGEFDGACCSEYGFCGTGITYCSAAAGCQAEFGAECTTP